MIVDTSALVAVIRQEPGHEQIVSVLAWAAAPAMSAASYVELCAVTARNAAERAAVNDLLESFEISLVPFDERQGAVAADAYARYGRSSGHPAGLNLGDCYSYALASTLHKSLLYVGDDFRQVDLASVLPD